uniref:Radical SAM additional 4Fe4S-binding SPASM domain-containing protein n=1 Tax=Candidatus Kentrum sp. UNK TaxID=2126344 RepID=A0A451AYN5_9GAMM|nr:MAG: radical SAM additional 4Fe4S-binding SPASM domain-containing protein [Candidatus Kentron sp. UNK]VFK71162.1 MAG: radical SAM additional 4Fe4S-binding SPASM domain-containing protein [Candidatus Kentron sp. UNK]
MLQLSAPLHVGISITNRCNLKCQHCIYSSGNADENELTTNEIHGLIDQIAGMNVISIEFLGGEPFFHKHLDDFVAHARERKLKVVMNTNGTLLTKLWLDQFQDAILLFKISFDGESSESHDNFRGVKGAYAKTTASIRMLQSRGIDTCLITTIYKGNLGQVEDILAKAAEMLSRGTYTVTVMMPLGRGENLADVCLSPLEVQSLLSVLHVAKQRYRKTHPEINIKEELPQAMILWGKDEKRPDGKRTCTAAISQMGISADGWAYPCTSMTGYRHNDHSVRTHRLIDIWNQSHLFRIVRDRQSVGGKCAQCEYLDQCGGGCRYAAWALGDGLQGEDPLCWYQPSGLCATDC